MKEIGGYFGLEQTKGDKEFYNNLISLNTARNALVYLVKAKGISKLYIPYYLCDSISCVLDREFIKYDFYHINDSFFPILDYTLHSDEYIYIVNYYGLLSNEEVIELKNKYHNVILDNTHSFFQEPLDNVDTIYSCRKFFGVPDGAYLSTNIKLNESLDVDDSSERMKHIFGRVKDGASVHYNEFKETDDSFYNLNLKYMSNLTHSLLKNIDYDYVIKTRKSNFTFLNKKLNLINKIDVSNVDIPFAYPLYLSNGINIRKELIKEKIYIPTLWPNVIGIGGIEEDYAMNILPIPCDQRYDFKDMDFIASLILNKVGVEKNDL